MKIKYLTCTLAILSFSFISSCSMQTPPVGELLNKNEKIVFASEGNSYQLTQSSLTPTKFDIPANFENFLNSQFSPDGKKIIYAISKNDPSNVSASDTYIMNVDGTNKINLPNISLGLFPRWSSDSKKIVFLSGNIYTVNSDGTDLKPLTNNAKSSYQNPVFSPDASKIAFLSYKDSENSGSYYLYTMNSDGSDIKRAINDDKIIGGGFDWLDNDKIIYTNGLNLYSVKTDGSGMSPLTTNTSVNTIYYAQPIVSQDKNKILFISNRDGNSEIYLRKIDSGSEIRLTNNNVKDEFPRWIND